METIIECEPDLAKPNGLLQESSPKLAIEHLIRSPVEACSEYTGNVIATDYHAFVAALHGAFVDHRPFVFSPDMAWLLIAQGFANHVNKNAEAMRSHFVSHDERKKIEVRRDKFIKGSLENPWENVFDEFSGHIRSEIGETNHGQIVAEFSTTGPIEKAANEVVLMDSLKHYFEYFSTTLCGIPEVRLEGSLEDWTGLAAKTEKLGNAFELQWWTDRLLPTLGTIAEHASGRGNPTFWRNIYKWNHSSGGPYINGWIVDFIPYVTTHGGLDRNWLFEYENDFEQRGMTTDVLPSGLSLVPFVWDYFDTRYDMEFVAGFTSFTQDADSFAVRPKIGWAVRDGE